MNKTNVLIGKTILSVEIASDKMAIKFVTDGGDVIAKADADCCSHTWIEHVSLPFKKFPALVLSAEDVEMPDHGSPDEYDVIRYYGFKILCDTGEILIDYRNESNGYYGGNLFWPDDGYFYGGVHGQNISTEEWQGLEGDL